MKNTLNDKFYSINQSELDVTDLDVLKKIFVLTEELKTINRNKIDIAIKFLDQIISKNPLALKSDRQKTTNKQPSTMNRYIEIIFDNSGSMNNYINNKQKHIIAKNIFKDTIIPKLDLKNDQVVLRTLSSGCKSGLSVIKRLDNDKLKMINTIDSISCYGSTPLYYTIKDSIEACNNVKANEKFIFILTDGDDTCFESPESILGIDFLKIKDQLNLNTILVQFAIESSITKNNLTAFSQKIGATNVMVSSSEATNLNIIEKKLAKAFIQSGLSKGGFPHCEVKNPENRYKLNELKEYDPYFVQLLFQEKLISWNPSKTKSIASEQLMGLDFVYTLRFRNCLPESLVKQMVLQLVKPYIYSFDCIYWDFKERVWKYFDEIPKLDLLDNPDALLADNLDNLNLEYKEKESELFDKRTPYEVILLPLNDKYNDRFKLVEFEYDRNGPTISLHEGDIVEFKK